MNISREEVLERLKRRTTIQEVTECWLWQGARTKGNHGVIGIEGKNYATHRLSAWIFLGFDLDSKEQVNHLCANPMCWNPQHIYVGTQSENIKDAVNLGTHYQASKTHCPQGHPYSEENTLLYGPDKKFRQCRICNRISHANKRHREGGL